MLADRGLPQGVSTARSSGAREIRESRPDVRAQLLRWFRRQLATVLPDERPRSGGRIVPQAGFYRGVVRKGQPACQAALPWRAEASCHRRNVILQSGAAASRACSRSGDAAIAALNLQAGRLAKARL